MDTIRPLGQSIGLIDPAAGPDPALGHKSRFEANGFRKLFYSVSFLLLAPFFISLPVMVYQRVVAGVWLDTWGLLVLTVAFAVVMFLLLGELVSALRSHVTLGESRVSYTLPERIGPFPSLAYRSGEIGYGDIATIETRREIYGGSIAPVFMTGARLITTSGDAHSLGYINEANADPTIPVPAIAREIARRAGVAIVDRGNVHRLITRKVRGVKSESDPVLDAEIATLNQRHSLVVVALIVVMIAVLAIGLYQDFTTPVG